MSETLLPSPFGQVSPNRTARSIRRDSGGRRRRADAAATIATMNLEELRANWNELGSMDPLWAILRVPEQCSGGSPGRRPRRSSVALRGTRSANLDRPRGLCPRRVLSGGRPRSRQPAQTGLPRRLGALRPCRWPARPGGAPDWFARSRSEFACRGIRAGTARDATGRPRPAARVLSATSGNPVARSVETLDAADRACSRLGRRGSCRCQEIGSGPVSVLSVPSSDTARTTRPRRVRPTPKEGGRGEPRG
jgi:hypothetical protein